MKPSIHNSNGKTSTLTNLISEPAFKTVLETSVLGTFFVAGHRASRNSVLTVDVNTHLKLFSQ